MKKDFTRDYATSAFRFWARQGSPTYDEAVEKIKKRALAQAGDVEPLKKLAFAETEVEKRSAMLCDIMACERVFLVLENNNKKYISAAVRAIYMSDPWHELRQNDVTSRVVRYSLKNHVSERQVYRYLREARALFCGFRGLRLSEED